MNLKKFHQVKGTEWQDQNFHWDRSWDLFGLTFFCLILRLFLRPNFFRPIPINIETATMLVCLETRRHTLVCGKEAFFRHECMEGRHQKQGHFTVRLTGRGGREGSPLGPDRKQMWKFWPISLKIWFFDTQNTFYLIVRGPKNAFFHALDASTIPLFDHFVTEQQQSVGKYWGL